VPLHGLLFSPAPFPGYQRNLSIGVVQKVSIGRRGIDLSVEQIFIKTASCFTASDAECEWVVQNFRSSCDLRHDIVKCFQTP
jgi:hypothetical protein